MCQNLPKISNIVLRSRREFMEKVDVKLCPEYWAELDMLKLRGINVLKSDQWEWPTKEEYALWEIIEDKLVHQEIIHKTLENEI